VANVTDWDSEPGEKLPAGRMRPAKKGSYVVVRSAEAYVMDASHWDESWFYEARGDDLTRYRHAEPSPFISDLADRIATICVPHAACDCEAAAQKTEASFSLFAADGHMRPFEEIEAEIIRIAVNRYDGRISEVARRLKIGRSTVYRKMDEFGIEHAQA